MIANPPLYDGRPWIPFTINFLAVGWGVWRTRYIWNYGAGWGRAFFPLVADYCVAWVVLTIPTVGVLIWLRARATKA